MTQAITKQSTQHQVQHPRGASSATQVHERSASANASAGLNLNLFGALSGAFSSQSKKSTRRDGNGGSVTDQETYEKGAAQAVAQGQGSAFAKANAEQREVKAKKVDHLGIEG